MATVEDHHETLPDLIKLATSHYILHDFMNHNHVVFHNDNRLGKFLLTLRVSPHVWAPVRWELEKEAIQILPEVYARYSTSPSVPHNVEFFYDDKSGRSLDWQIDAMKRHLFDGIPMLVKHGVGAWEKQKIPTEKPNK